MKTHVRAIQAFKNHVNIDVCVVQLFRNQRKHMCVCVLYKPLKPKEIIVCEFQTFKNQREISGCVL